ncbi:Pericentrin [Caenorhabditis elegans]|uniref:Pericentrin n=1 Tax=Caenorhabditis elegans TaxID=6239 RepID=Q20198_CAEEL|nr:Pericentrin [Caenorhabditis elegans]CCD69991.1 Pericentrin [Caenorhabditis elegans]|eukprot:NP_508164.2 Uncharacterized protein CELE_F39H12.1 [Caenorhabditis elegans]
MNVNWKEAILQAQKRIDQVLDIRPEAAEVEVDVPDEVHAEQECSSPSQGSEPLADDIVMLEPVLPPFHNNRYIGDDIQTIISSDIEHLTRASSRTASPDRLRIIPMEFDTDISISSVVSPAAALTPAPAPAPAPVAVPEVTLPNPEEILNQAIYGLRKELTEYKKANQFLQHSHANLEREMEENRFSVNEKVVNMLSEERDHFHQEISNLKHTCSQLTKEKIELEEKYQNSTDSWHRTQDVLQYFRNQISQMKGALQKTEETFISDFETFGAEIKRSLENQAKRKSSSPKIIQLPCNCENKSREQTNQVVKHDESTQTKSVYIDESHRWEREEKEIASSPNGKNGNVTDLLQIIEQLEMEKRLLLAQRRSDKAEIERLQEQLNETLIMHGEKIEQLDEILVDNEELKDILKQQALALTDNIAQSDEKGST